MIAPDATDPDPGDAQQRLDLIPAPAFRELATTGTGSQSGFTVDDRSSAPADVPRYLHALRRRWLMALVIALPISAAATLAFWFLLPRTYTATALLRLAVNESTLLFETADSSRAGPNAFEVYKRTQRQLLRSRFVISRALRGDNLVTLAALEGEPNPVAWLETNLSVTFPDEAEVMHVSLTARKPDGVHQLVNAIVQAYFDEVVLTERKRKFERLSSLDLASKKAESELRSKRTEFKQLVERVGSGDSNALTLQQQQVLQQVAGVQQQATKIRFDLMQAEGELELHKTAVSAVEQGAEEGDVIVSHQELLLAMRTDPKAGQLRAERQKILDLTEEIRRRMKEGVVEAKLKEQLRRLESCDEKIVARQVELRKEMIEQKRQSDAAGEDALTRKIRALKAQDTQLQTKLRDLETETRHFGRSSVDVEMLRSEISALQEVAGRLSSELERTRVEHESDSKNSWNRVSRLSEAEPARNADKGRWTKIILGGLASLLISAYFVLWIDVRKERVNSGTEIIYALGLPVIGSVPLVPERVMRRLNGTSAKEKYWRTLLSESVDSVAAVLLRKARKRGRCVVMVSSATAGEGKTTLAANLATSLAGSGCHTVLVDFDLRRPALHRVFGLSLAPGLNDVVLRDLNEFHAAIQYTQIPNLAFLAAGRWSATGLSGLASCDLKSLFAMLRSEFEFVVVDASPVLPIVDTRVIAQHVDTVVLSVLRDVSRLPQLRATGQLLESFGVPILGVVLTGSRLDAYPDSRYEPYVEAKAV